MFVEIKTIAYTTPSGEVVEDVSTIGLLLSIDDEEVAVPIADMEDVYLDDEDMSKATRLYVSYQGEEYEFDVPERDSANWQMLEQIIETE